MDDWDKLDQQYSGGKVAEGSGDPWADLDAQFSKPQAKAAEAPKAKTVAQLPKKGGQTRFDRLVQGMRDPIDGGAQLLANLLPEGVVNAGNAANNWLADKTGMVARLPEGGVNQQTREREAAYQQARKDSTGEAEPGLDGYRLTGNIVSPVNLAAIAKLPKVVGMGKKMMQGAAFGGGMAALNPVVGEGDYGDQKRAQIGLGAGFGAAAPLVIGGIGRVIAPKAASNPNLQLLKDEGVNPTIGQALGGRMNTLEEKLTSLPITGDAISMARQRALEQFNKAAINRATAPIGQQVDDIGQAGVMKAGDKLSQSYDDALSGLGPVTFDNTFASQVGQLQGMANNLIPAMRDKFMKTYQDIVVGRMSPNGTMLPDAFKKVDSELGNIAARYGKSSVASEQEAGDAIRQLQALVKQQAARSDPAMAAKVAQSDEGWANLVRLEGAAKAAKNNEGVFTPAQLNSAIQTADQSVRKRAVSRGEALMQDLGNAGQMVLGNKVPNSFTTDRALIGLGGLGSGVVSPVIPASLLGGAAAYTSPVQKALVAAVSSRPEIAKKVAKALNKNSMLAVPLASQYGPGLLSE